jgi:hypothetical protein
VGAALCAVLLVNRWTSAEQQQAAMDEEWDE